MADPYFDSANKQIDESKKGLLDAVAQAGTAGKQAYDAAQQQAAAARQDALNRAAQSRALYGVGGSDQTILGAYDARMNQMGVNRANFESGLAQTQASGDSYLEKARAAIPVLQAVNTNKLTDQETKIKLAIQAAKDKAEAEAQKQAAAQQAQIDRENRAEQRSIDRENRAAEKAAAKENMPSTQGLLGLASQYAKGQVNPVLNAKAAGPVRNSEQPAREKPDQGLTDIAAQIGRALGIPEAKIAELFSPSQQASLLGNIQNVATKSAPPPTPDQKWLVSNVRGYDTKKAQQVLADPDFKAAGATAQLFATSPLDADGTITEAGPYQGLTPRQAFAAWLAPLKHTWTDAAIKYYGGYLDSMNAK